MQAWSLGVYDFMFVFLSSSFLSFLTSFDGWMYCTYPRTLSHSIVDSDSMHIF